LVRIAKLYAIEKEIRGGAPDVRRTERQARSKPIVEALKPWLEGNLAKISKGSPLADVIRYGLNHWDGLVRFLDDGRIELDTNTVERSIRPLVLTRNYAQVRIMRSCRCRRSRGRNRYSRVEAWPRSTTAHNQRPWRNCIKRSGGLLRAADLVGGCSLLS